ncbi:hypothetical protein [Streptomyces sp. TBY4]|uniref:hypothetical protein n=1 Tax=Streptomyces sp. TBY4 TaxID=2962030 RepID=UPI0020B79125|nr:hypothetical protein [Streptomyces sp. TBY4]MCP3760142.1 hypothetical protein [Streptomyces sp. TBY4]
MSLDLPHLFARLSELVHADGHAPEDLVVIPRSELDRRETAAFTAGWAEAMAEDLPRIRREYEKRVVDAYAAGGDSGRGAGPAGRRGPNPGAGTSPSTGAGSDGAGRHDGGAEVIRLPFALLLDPPALVTEAEERIRRARQPVGRGLREERTGGERPDEAQPRDERAGGAERGDAQFRDGRARGEQPGDAPSRGGRAGGAEPGDAQPGDGRLRGERVGDAQPGDGRARGERLGDGPARDEQAGDAQPGGGPSRDAQPRDGRARERQADAGHQQAAAEEIVAEEPRAHEQPGAGPAPAAQEGREKRAAPAGRKVVRRRGRPIVPPLRTIPVQPRAQAPSADAPADGAERADPDVRRSLVEKARALAQELETRGGGGGRPEPAGDGRRTGDRTPE